MEKIELIIDKDQRKKLEHLSEQAGCNAEDFPAMAQILLNEIIEKTNAQDVQGE